MSIHSEFPTYLQCNRTFGHIRDELSLTTVQSKIHNFIQSCDEHTLQTGAHQSVHLDVTTNEGYIKLQ